MNESDVIYEQVTYLDNTKYSDSKYYIYKIVYKQLRNGITITETYNKPRDPGSQTSWGGDYINETSNNVVGVGRSRMYITNNPDGSFIITTITRSRN